MKLYEEFSKKKVLIVGDYCIDEFLEGEAESVSPEAPVLRVFINKIKTNPGMTGNIVIGIKALGAETYAVGIIGNDENSKKLIHYLKKQNINTEGMFLQKGRITPKFSRIVVGGERYPKQSAIRFDIENKKGINQDSLQKIIEFIYQNKDADAIIVADYDEVGGGIINKNLLDKIVNIARQNNIILIGDSRKNLHNFYNFTCLVPNLHEAKLVYEKEFEKKVDSTLDMPKELIERLKLDAILITKDKEGMEMTTKERTYSIPAFAEKVVDVTGAGDTVTCVLTLGLCSGLDYYKATKLAGYGAAIAVSKQGLAAVTLDEIKYFKNK